MGHEEAGEIILTGFEPFGGASVNPSWEGVRLVPDVVDNVFCGRIRVVKIKLPVVFGKACDELKKAIDAIKPGAVICTGVAAGRKSITPEVIAVNLMNASSPDNAGNCPHWEKIDPSGPDGLFSTLPNLSMVNAVNALGISAELSFSAGTFVCNDLFYRLMSGILSSGFYTALPAGFIHVPDIDPRVIAAALTECIKALNIAHSL